MSLLLDAEKLRRKLEKLEAKRTERLKEVASDYDQKIAMAKDEAGPDVVCLPESAENLGPSERKAAE